MINDRFMIDHFFAKKIMTRMQKERQKTPHTKACEGEAELQNTMAWVDTVATQFALQSALTFLL
jgi:hypothetical protein